MVYQAVPSLENIGLTVVAVACDQEASHRQLYTAPGGTVHEPVHETYFTSANGRLTYLLFDMRHLLHFVVLTHS